MDALTLHQHVSDVLSHAGSHADRRRNRGRGDTDR